MVAELEQTRANPLADLTFRYPLRKYQKEILELVNIKLERGERKLHIVAPPGAGKTIMGLQIISQLKCNSLILCPNTTIQSQWGQKFDLFLPPGLEGLAQNEFIGTHEDRPLKPITLLTYQVLSTPGREQEYLERLAHQSWVDEIVKSMSVSAGEAELRILELMQNNPKARQKEISRHVSRLRRKLTEVMDLKDVLHGNALELLQALRRQKFQLVLFDECHHLTDYWAAVMHHLLKRLDNPVVIGLTGTPPEGKTASQETRYLQLVGEIDYQVPTPALVREGGLSPFQDLVYFTEPTTGEMDFLERQHEQFHELIEELTKPTAGAVPTGDGQFDEATAGSISEAAAPPEQTPGHGPLTSWVLKRTAALEKDDWSSFQEKRPEAAAAVTRFLWKMKLPIPHQTELSDSLRQAPFLADWMILLEDFALNYLKTSAKSEDHKLYAHTKDAVRKLGYGLTEQGIRRQASPVDRVLAYSKSKPLAVAQILQLEYKNLQDRLRAVVVTDFEQMSATTVKALKGVLNEESGGAKAVLRELLNKDISQYVNPALVTGSLLVVDRRVTDQFVEAAREYLRREGYDFELLVRNEENALYSEITAGSSNWETRLYVGLATELFERGIVKCLVGTRGIFGEGWDSQSLNTLIDLTTTTSPVSVKQLRGRSIRINTSDPLAARKVANNWDVVCIAPALEKGLNDYDRFARKHTGYFGISDDGQIESGVGHVHPSFSELTPAEVFASSQQFNSEMLERALARENVYELWKVGQPYGNRELGCVEVSGLRKIALTPPHIRRNLKYKPHARQLRSALNGIWWEFAGLGCLASSALAYFLTAWGVTAFAALLPLAVALELGRRKHKALYGKLQSEICQPNTQESSLSDIGIALVSTLKELKLLPRTVGNGDVRASIRADGSYRIFLDNVEPEHSRLFANTFKEVMAPVSNQPYLIPKYEYSFPKPRKKGETNEEAFFKAYLRGRAEPRIGSYHALPKIIARSEKGRESFQESWNKYVSPGFVIATEKKPELLDKYFGVGPSLSQRLLWT
jgi:superfamily II DNA or RNA helicase